ncbi:Dihydropteroate synthase [Pseudovibrio axinellae]|uniref:Dihydropteroate synthase n=1 Tax=Pseudovibrio axinellae TaxID=989403 RepID=A0A165X3W3_9HYPH|nr:dihydropteroate synthase [Pseudovibrio axinellae]KZL17327.1 Dihydropteroate synthase [Pseudovibrio axinellae]SEQ20473.1 Dihydropteroate synthase [Pseudovibrio axinellae]
MAEFDHGFLESSQRPLVMGILNVTPDSFSDGGQFDAPAMALAHAREMIAEGADIIDVGGESTRPGATIVQEHDELERVLPVLELIKELPVLISIDTYKACVAAEACKAGAHIVNDVWGLQKDPEMAGAVADAGVPVIMMHNRTEVDEKLDIMSDIDRFFEKSLRLASDAGIPEELQVLDPGFGFGKTLQQNYQVLSRLTELQKFGCPILAGASRKRMIGHVLNNEAQERMAGTLAVHTLALQNGAQILRVHDVKPHVDAVRIFQAMKELGGDLR